MAKSRKEESIIRQINDNPLSRKEVVAFPTEAAKLPRKERDFTCHHQRSPV